MTRASQHSELRFTEYILDNGLHVVLHEDHTTPIVAVDVCYHVGSKNENPERTGFAHLFEHLMFDGSPNVGRGQFDEFITKAGGWNNAYTAWDKTNYYEVLPSHQLELALWLESDRMTALTITDVSLTTQRNVVKEERRWRVENQPYGTAEEQVFARAYTMHPYRWPVIGSMEHLDRASLEDVNIFFRQYYTPDNATLVITGDFEPEAVQTMVQRYFGGIRSNPGSQPRLTSVEPPQISEVRGVIVDNVQLPAVYMAFHIPEEGHHDYYAMALLSDVFSNGESSRLFQRLVYTKKIAKDVMSYVLNLEDPGLLWISSTGMKSVTAESIENEILYEIDRICDVPVTGRELQKVKNQTEASMTFGRQRADQKADLLAHYAAIHGSAAMINTEIERFLAVTVDDLHRVAQKYLSKDNRTVVHYLPKQYQDIV
jgi:predicted Zn-dependent peptidase